MEDHQIIQLFLERKEEALQETSVKYGAYIRTIAGNILGNREDVEECENDTYLRAWNTIPPNLPRKLSAYLAVLVREVSIDCFRKNHRLKRFGSEYDASYEELSEVLSDDKNDPENVVERIALGSLLNRFLEGRGEDVRTALVLRYFYMYSVEEIAACLGSSVPRIKTMLHRERKTLRKFLEKEGYEG